MMINWAEAARIAGGAFGVVLLVLLILALAIKAIGLVIIFLGIDSRNKGPNDGKDKK